MTISLHGLGVSRGVAIGKAHILERGQIEIPEYGIPPQGIAAEHLRFRNALMMARQQLRAIREHIPRGTAADIAAFIDTHLLMLDDLSLSQEPIRIIAERRCNAEWALKLQRDALVAVFNEMDDPYLRTRKDDVDHVVNRIQRVLLNHAPLRHEVPDSRLRGYIILADDLAPADTVLMQHHGIAGFVTEYGGPTSHTAILARSFEIPSIVGLHHARRYVREDDLIIVDGARGVVVVDPDAETQSYYRGVSDAERAHHHELRKLKGTAAVTRDGVRIRLEANIELPQDYDAVLGVGADGVGLYRTEYLYMNRDAPPDEEEQFARYSEVLSVLRGLPITIRTLDLGADKPIDGRGAGPMAANPALGLRAVRWCLNDPGIFLPQLRAILRASALGPLRLLIPMLSSLQELQQVQALIEEVQAELRGQGLAYDAEMPIGGMIEVPAAAVCADLFARQLDFLSIGTNDLIQYSIAIDRVNEAVSYLYDPVHPGVLRLIRGTIEAAVANNKPVAMCGEMAGDLRYVRLLLGLGLREFSVHPTMLLEIKRVIKDTRIDETEPTAQRLLHGAVSGDLVAELDRLNAGIGC